MSEKIKLNWLREDIANPVSNLLGYATLNSMLKKYGEKYFDYSVEADITINPVPADYFVPVPGKFNILFTMWETLTIPDSYKRNLNKADLIIVPSSFCRDVFRPYTSVPIEVCHLGIEPDKFPYQKREFPYVATSKGLLQKKPGQRFRLLWIGAPNPRKGYYSVMELINIFENIPEYEIYIKTTAFKKSTLKEFLIINYRRLRNLIKNYKNKKVISEEISLIRQSFKRMMKPALDEQVQVMGKHKNIIIDMRKLPFEELEQLYNTAHVFLSPHSGEGWNLPLCEAMATGLPCIATGASGCLDFFNEDVGYFIKYDIKEIDLQNYDLKTNAFIPDTQDLLNRVFEVFGNYPAALRKGDRASYRIHNKFTWDKSAMRLKEIIDIHYKESVTDKNMVKTAAN